MSDALSIAVNGLNSSSLRSVKAASSIVNASSTGANSDPTASLVGLTEDKTSYAANAKVIRAVAEDNKSLIDILA